MPLTLIVFMEGILEVLQIFTSYKTTVPIYSSLQACLYTGNKSIKCRLFFMVQLTTQSNISDRARIVMAEFAEPSVDVDGM